MNAKHHHPDTFFERNRFSLEIAAAIFSVLLNAAGLYFVYRWGRTLQRASPEVKLDLLGPTLGSYTENGEYIALIVAIYLGYKMLVFLIQAADWQQYLNVAKRHHHENIY